MRALASLVVVCAAISVVPCASADEAPKSPAAASPVRALTDLDDARACKPLASGGFAVATGGGLAIVARDGTAKTLTSLDGLPDTRVHALAEQGDALWVGTESGAALVSLGGAPKITRTIRGAPVHAVHASASGAVYFGVWGAGLMRVASAEGKLEPVPSALATHRVAAIAENNGALYAAYADGPLARLDGGTMRPVAGSPTHGQALASITGTDGASRLLLGDLEGLFRVDPGAVTSIASVDARGIAQGDGGSAFVGTFGAGTMTGSPRGALRSVPLGARFVQGVGSRGAVRCAATTRGLYVDQGSGKLEKLALGGPPSNDVTAVASLGDRVAVGTFDAGAAIYERGAFTRVAGLEPNEAVSSLAWQGQGPSARLWLGTAHGLVRIEADGAMRRLRAADGLPHSYVRAIHVLSAERVLVATDAGPAFVERDRVTPLVAIDKTGPQPLASPMHASWAVASAADGTLFVGTTSGLYWGKDGRYERASLATGDLADDWVTALAVDGDDLFAGTYAHGVSRLRFAGGKHDTRPQATQLGGGYVNPDGLALSNGRLYAATMDGLLTRSKNDDAPTWITRRDAAPGRDVTAARFLGSGEVWISSRRGIGVRSVASLD